MGYLWHQLILPLLVKGLRTSPLSIYTAYAEFIGCTSSAFLCNSIACSDIDVCVYVYLAVSVCLCDTVHLLLLYDSIM